ncbi:MAG: glycerol-3-phosphate 1-O-acyltransferase PlsY [Gemmatimonadota bacterium]|nr:MAG: glycerol-3-phosphate 1-O-acyltransferase PlsY [Gemmatimonadota bacterium]
MRPALLVLVAYLLGSIPFGYAAGRLTRVDLQAVGSGSTGATNVFRALGPRWAVSVTLLDVLKGFLPVWLFPMWDGTAWLPMAILYGIAAVAGHVWSVFLRFRGGKGVATAAGAMLALAPIALIIAALVWVGLTLITGYVSVASLVAASLLPLLTFLEDAPIQTVIFSLGIAAFVWWTHRSNLVRLVHGEELGFRAARNENAAGGGPPDGPSL